MFHAYEGSEADVAECALGVDVKQDYLASLLEGLSGPQREAVTHTDGALLILAGPGSGKTRVVTRRAAHLACTVTQPSHILAITFTNKAAQEMRSRIEALDVGRGMTVSTFHALCARLLRIHGDRAGIGRNFTIYDRDDRRKLIKQAIEDSALSADHLSPATVEEAISLAKNGMIGAGGYAEEASDWRERMIARVFERYEQLMRSNGAMDFDDLLMRVTLLLEKDHELRAMLNRQYRYVLVDEYQDTNATQYRLARLLAQDHGNLCVTGDPDQSIYGWRGADIRNILDFERDFPDAKVVRLEQNYRSTKKILAVADTLIQANLKRKHKTLWTENKAGDTVRIVEVESAEEEAAWVATDIQRRVVKGGKLSDVAIFYRVNALSRAIEEAFLHKGVAYQIARGVEFYARKEIKDVLAYLKVLSNPADEIALMRIINTPARGIGDTTIERLQTEARHKGLTIFEALGDDDLLSNLGRSAMKVREFGRLLQSLLPLLELPPSKALSEIISRSGLRAMYSSEGRTDDAPAENLDELVSAAAVFEEQHPGAAVIDWLEHAALVSDVDSVEGEKDCVTMMTLHAAKGLEFPVVYIVGMEDGLLPFRRSFDDYGMSQTDMEEERRLCFVGMTRAEESLTLTRARYRMLRGITQRTTLSPFLDELPKEALEWVELDDSTPRRAPRVERPHDIEEWTIGTLVRHPLLGLGRIMAIERSSRRTFVDVAFQNGSRKTMVVEFADLERADFEAIDD